MPLALTHQEIADILGTARETVTRTLKQFKRSNLIVVDRAKISIRDRAGMQRLLAG
jgi:CRP/FNR family transcriptional regulator